MLYPLPAGAGSIVFPAFAGTACFREKLSAKKESRDSWIF